MSENPDKPNINEAGKSKSNDSEQDLEDAVKGSDAALQKTVKSSSPSAQRVQRPHSSPPRFVTVEELLETAKGVTNMALAHEIVVNGDFRIKPVELPEDSLEKRVKEIVHKAFWDCLSVQLSEDPPTYDHAIKLVGEIKETLLSFLLPGHTRLRNQITEVLDLDLIKQEAENGALDISKLAEFIIGMMGTLCAPARDEEVKKLKDIKEIVPLFRAIFSVLDLMKVDMANFAITSIRPHLMQQSVEYERKKFQQLLEKQPNSLDFVTQWLEEAAEDLTNQKYKSALPAGGGAAGSGDGPTPSPMAVQNYAYLKLLRWDHLRRPFPETVLMDQARFQELQLQLEHLTVLGAVLLVTFSMAAPGISSQADFAEKLKMIVKILLTDTHLPSLILGSCVLPQRDSGYSSFHLKDALTTIGEKVCLEVSSCLALCGLAPFTTEKEAVLKGQIQAVASPDDPIRRIMVIFYGKSSRDRQFFPNHFTPALHRSQCHPWVTQEEPLAERRTIRISVSDGGREARKAHGLVLSQLMRTVQKRPGEEGLTKHQPVSFLGVVQVRSCPQLRGLPLEALQREVHIAYMWAWWEKLTNP